jgi:hypothetical protein
VIQIRNDLMAEENLDLCERLLRRFGDAPLPYSAKATLLLALHQQGREKDAKDLAAEIKKSAEDNQKQILELLGKLPGWNPSRLRGLPNGTFALNLEGLKIDSPASLTLLPVSELKLDKTPLSEESDWSETLPKLPLKSLSLRSCKLSDLSVLEGTRVDVLDLSDNPLSDLTPLQGLPLRQLNLSRTEAPDLTPLANCHKLEDLVLPESARNVELLKPLSSLQRISTKEAYGNPAQTAQEFWATRPQPSGAHQ